MPLARLRVEALHARRVEGVEAVAAVGRAAVGSVSPVVSRFAVALGEHLARFVAILLGSIGVRVGGLAVVGVFQAGIDGDG